MLTSNEVLTLNCSCLQWWCRQLGTVGYTEAVESVRAKSQVVKFEFALY